MKRFLLAASMFFVWLAIASTYYMCVIKGLCGDSEPETTVVQTPKKIKKQPIITVIEAIKDTLTADKEITHTIDTLKSAGFKIYDNDYLLKSYRDNFKIYKNSPQIKISFNISEYGYVLAKHMDSVDSALLVKGFHNQEETTEHGLQRANFIKDRLIELGIPETLVTTMAQPAIYEYDSNKFFGGIQFNFKKADSVITLNKIDYSYFKNVKEVAKVIPKEIIPEKVIINDSKSKYNISDSEMLSITKKNITEVPPVEIKAPLADKTTSVTFTATEKYFKNGKFKASKKFKNFIKDHITAKNIQLIGYSNADKNSDENYDKGLELVNLVNIYLLNEANYKGEISTNALKNRGFLVNGIKKEGVTIIIQ